MIVAVALGLPLSVSAQSVDARYCSALANKYAGFLAATNQQSQDPQAVSARGIPLLESSLRNAGVDLPPREAPSFIRVTHGHSKGG